MHVQDFPQVDREDLRKVLSIHKNAKTKKYKNET